MIPPPPFLMQPASVGCASASATPIRFAREILAPARPLLLSDVADLSMLPASLRSRADRLTLARRVEHDQRLAVPSLILRIRGRMPALGCWLPQADHSMIVVHRAPAPQDAIRAGAGRIVPAWRQAASVKTGDKVRLSVRAGAVRIDRQVEALQPARPGGRLFVRTNDGSTLSVRLSGDAQ